MAAVATGVSLDTTRLVNPQCAITPSKTVFNGVDV